MKPPTRAPFYACLYPGLCEVARKHGYALAIHGTVTSDLDLIAVPWVDYADSPEILRKALMKRLAACGYEELLRQEGHGEEFIKQMIETGHCKEMDASEKKPHGRIAWNLHMEFGCKVDLSVMPRVHATQSTQPIVFMISASNTFKEDEYAPALTIVWRHYRDAKKYTLICDREMFVHGVRAEWNKDTRHYRRHYGSAMHELRNPAPMVALTDSGQT